MLNPVHPGTILRISLGEMEVSEAAAHLKVSRPTLSKIINGRAGISADMALGLEAFLGNPSEFWLDLQKQYELAQAKASQKAALPANGIENADSKRIKDKAEHIGESRAVPGLRVVIVGILERRKGRHRRG